MFEFSYINFLLNWEKTISWWRSQGRFYYSITRSRVYSCTQDMNRTERNDVSYCILHWCFFQISFEEVLMKQCGDSVSAQDFYHLTLMLGLILDWDEKDLLEDFLFFATKIENFKQLCSESCFALCFSVNGVCLFSNVWRMWCVLLTLHNNCIQQLQDEFKWWRVYVSCLKLNLVVFCETIAPPWCLKFIIQYNFDIWRRK